jgi:hypothetical protein
MVVSLSVSEYFVTKTLRNKTPVICLKFTHVIKKMECEFESKLAQYSPIALADVTTLHKYIVNLFYMCLW